jgi:glycosyltransferase involved in cell wall biosynthesis
MTRPAVLHLDGSTGWGGGQNQVRLLIRELAKANVPQLCFTPTASPLSVRLKELDLPVRTLSWRGGSDPRVMWSVLRALRDFNIVHCHDAHALQIALLPATLRRAHVIGARRVPFKTSAYKWNRAERVIAVSHTVGQTLLDSGVDQQRIRVIYSGTDLHETRAVAPLQPPVRTQLGIPASAFVLVNAAQMIEAKGQLVIPAAAARLPDVHWLIAGEGPLREPLQAAIAQHGVADRVHLLGWLPDSRALLKEADAYVSTSIEEGLGNSITESLAMGVPVLSANSSGGAEVMRPVHERTGAVFFETSDAESLAGAVIRLREPGMRERVLAAQDERFADFNIQRTVAETIAVYREVLTS